MARKTETYTVEDEGRDKGKVYLLTEWPASRAESWAIRALLALGASNVDVPAGIMNEGMAELARVGVKQLFALSYTVAGPLLDELMECVQVTPDSKRPQVKRALVENDIEEIKTRFNLKLEVLKLHIDFSIAGEKSKLVGETPVVEKSSPSKISLRR